MTSTANSYEFAPTTEPKLNRILGQPWRFRCPDPRCRSTTVIVRKKLADSAHEYHEYQSATPSNDPREPHIHDFRCGSCSQCFDEPFDAKEGTTHPVHEV